MEELSAIAKELTKQGVEAEAQVAKSHSAITVENDVRVCFEDPIR